MICHFLRKIPKGIESFATIYYPCNGGFFSKIPKGIESIEVVEHVKKSNPTVKSQKELKVNI